MTTSPVNLFDFDHDGLRDYFVEQGEKPYRAKQLMQWVYQRNCRDFSQMSDMSVSLREKLAATATLELPQIDEDHLSSDGTCKWLFALHDGNRIETVYIPEKGRGTLCISSQVGCALDCSFCATGRQGFARNLSVAEIIGQLWLATNSLASNSKTSHQRITNIVMMGMGEPLLNFKALIPSLRLMMDDRAYGLSKRRVTVSTSGVVPAMDRLTNEIDCSLAVSLHAPTDELRNELVPLNKKYNIEQLMDACWRYVQGERKKKVLFEYVMLDGVNDQAEHARQLARLLKSFPGKVNLIPFNPFETSGYRTSSKESMERFSQILIKAGVLTLKRATRGEDIDAACGQLAGDITDKSRRYIRFTEPRYGEQFR
ncbi:MAG: 23S rRNA (adenine(2503)-C(2))-methyltransferase RlmN [Granulosicoccaceae bacterium]